MASAETNSAFLEKVLQNKLALSNCQCVGKENGRRLKSDGPCQPYQSDARDAAFNSEESSYKLATDWGSFTILKNKPANYNHHSDNGIVSPSDGRKTGIKEHVVEVGVADEEVIQQRHTAQYIHAGKTMGTTENSVEIRRVDDSHVTLMYKNRETDGVHEKSSDVESCDGVLVPRDDMSHDGAVKFPALNLTSSHGDTDVPADEPKENSAE